MTEKNPMKEIAIQLLERINQLASKGEKMTEEDIKTLKDCWNTTLSIAQMFFPLASKKLQELKMELDKSLTTENGNYIVIDLKPVPQGHCMECKKEIPEKQKGAWLICKDCHFKLIVKPRMEAMNCQRILECENYLKECETCNRETYDKFQERSET